LRSEGIARKTLQQRVSARMAAMRLA